MFDVDLPRIELFWSTITTVWPVDAATYIDYMFNIIHLHIYRPKCTKQVGNTTVPLRKNFLRKHPSLARVSTSRTTKKKMTEYSSLYFTWSKEYVLKYFIILLYLHHIHNRCTCYLYWIRACSSMQQHQWNSSWLCCQL
jgi:hypothetical protein